MSSEVPRKIVHVDMDAFYASVEQRDDPSLRGKPVVVAWRGARSVVCAASYEARRFGVKSAMPAIRAERLCPDAVFVPPDFLRYRAVSRQTREIFSRHTDLIEPLSLDEAYLDVSVNKRFLPTATAVAEEIRSAIREELNLTASAGVAPNKFLAKIASDWRKPDGLFVLRPHQVQAFLEPLPVARLPGVGKVTEAKLQAQGFATVGDLAAASVGVLREAFGSYGQRLWELARGIDDHPVVVERPTQQISAEDTFSKDLLLDEFDDTLLALAEKVWSQAEREPDRVGRTVVLKLKTQDFRLLTRSVTPLEPPDSAQVLGSLALSLKARVDLPERTRYRLAGVGLGHFADRHELEVQGELFGHRVQE